jgi:signal transduction histidine kinase
VTPSSDAALERLHGATRALLNAESKPELASVAVDAATDVLEFPFSVVWYTTPAGDALRAGAVSDPVRQYVSTPEDPGKSMRHERGSRMWQWYERDEPKRVTFSREMAASDTPLHSGIVVPLGDDGLLTAGTHDRRDLTDRELRLASILGKNLEAALSRTIRETDLATQRDTLETVNQIVRHDIRNDLQLVVAHAERLAEDSDHESIDSILEQAESAVDLTKTARTLTDAVLRSGADLEAVALRPTVRTEVETIRAASRMGTVTVDGSIPDARVVADDMLSSVVRNLVENAIEHAGDDPTVTVSAEVADDEARLHVADDGPGVPERMLDDVFEKGERGPRSDGTGIGLYLVRTLVGRYGGTVDVENDDGAVFTVTLPLAE